MRILGVVFLILVFMLVWFCFAPIYFLADVGEYLDGVLDRKIDRLFRGL